MHWCPWCGLQLPQDNYDLDECPRCEELFCPDCFVRMDVNELGVEYPVSAHLPTCWLGRSQKRDPYVNLIIGFLIFAAVLFVFIYVMKDWRFWNGQGR